MSAASARGAPGDRIAPAVMHRRPQVLTLAARVVIVLALALTFYPLVKAYTLGQIQNWLNGLFALALCAG